MKTTHCYDDIISLPHPVSATHPPMPMAERAGAVEMAAMTSIGGSFQREGISFRFLILSMIGAGCQGRRAGRAIAKNQNNSPKSDRPIRGHNPTGPAAVQAPSGFYTLSTVFSTSLCQPWIPGKNARFSRGPSGENFARIFLFRLTTVRESCMITEEVILKTILWDVLYDL